MLKHQKMIRNNKQTSTVPPLTPKGEPHRTKITNQHEPKAPLGVWGKISNEKQ
jgi:hypothetical protein